MGDLLKRLLLALVVAAMIAAGAGYVWLANWIDAPIGTDEPIVLDIAPGSAFSTISNDLAATGAVQYPRLLSAYARAKGAASKVQAGEYVIAPGATPALLLEQLTSGDVLLYSFTIVEGWNIRELLGALAEHEAVSHTLDSADTSALGELLGLTYPGAEGVFLPETYRFPRGTTDLDVLRRAQAAMESALAEEWAGRAEDLPLATPYEALTLASIIEKETALAEERPRIAGVFVRRLEKRMRLQTDPTVIYGLGEAFDGNLTRRHLRTDTPYNTYTRAGLPPGPIAMPGRAAINAALHPADGNELYFVATGLGDGSHHFSATREEHEAAVAEYLARLRGQRQGN